MFGYPFMMPPYGGGGSPPGDPIEQLEKTLAFCKRIRDEDKKDKDNEKNAEKAKKKTFILSEWFMFTLMTSSVVQTVLILWLVRGK